MIMCKDCEYVGDIHEFTYLLDKKESKETGKLFAIQCPKCKSRLWKSIDSDKQRTD